MNLFKAILKRLGVDVFLRKKDHHYVLDYYGHAAPKMLDIRGLPEFGTLAQEVIDQGRTLLYYDRLYTIYQAIKNVARLPEVRDSEMAEVGVYKGGGSYFIALTLAALELKSVNLNCFDTFSGHAQVDVRAEDPFQKATLFNDTSLESVQKYLSIFENVKTYKGRFQDTNFKVDRKKFSFIHLDMDLYEPTAYALDFFSKRLLSGGIIIVDDYGFLTCPGVKQAVDHFMKETTGYFGLCLLTGQYIITKH